MLQPAVVHHTRAKGGVSLREVPIPEPPADGVVVRVAAVGVCRSDVTQYLNRQAWRVTVPVVLGHEFAGVVEAVGKDVTSFVAGDRVVAETVAATCGHCSLCRSGRDHLCPRRLEFGCSRDGAMTQHISVPVRSLHRVPDGLSLETAALCEPCCVAYHAVAIDGDIKPGMRVAVLGCGPIGLLCLQVAKLCGASPVVLAGLSIDENQLHIGQKLGADHTVAVDRDDLRALAGWLDDGLGFDVVIDAAGDSLTLQEAMDIVRPGGRIAKVDGGPTAVAFSMDPLTRKGVTVKGSLSCAWPVWDRVLAMLGRGQLDCSPVVSTRLPLTRWQEAFEGMHDGTLVKAILEPNGA